jgi:hypothetical protein
MEFTNRISRAQIAAQLGIQTQTIAKWERLGSFPAAKEHISDRVILYDRDEVLAAIARRLAEKPRRIPPRRP